jgi:hypothetical protein
VESYWNGGKVYALVICPFRFKFEKE